MHPSLVRAAVSPTAVAVTAAGVGIGVLDHSVVVAVILGVGAWVGRMAAAVVSRSRRERAARPKPAQLDPYSVPEPWRQLLRQALDAQARFDHSVQDWPGGPIKERLATIQPRLWGDVEQVGTIARRGAALSGWVAGVAGAGRPSAQQLADQLRATEAERQRVGAGSERQASLLRTEEALAAQIRALHNATEAEAMVADRLRVIVARLDESVTSLLVLGAGGGESDADALMSSLDQINEEITSLSKGLAEASSTANPALPPASPPPAPPTP